jgi:hypothetical protein
MFSEFSTTSNRTSTRTKCCTSLIRTPVPKFKNIFTTQSTWCTTHSYRNEEGKERKGKEKKRKEKIIQTIWERRKEKEKKREKI